MVFELDGLEKKNWFFYNNKYESKNHSFNSLLRIGLRLDEIAKRNELDHDQLGKKLKIPSIELSKMIAGKTPVPDEVLDKIELEFPKIDVVWLHTGKGKMIKEKNNINNLET